MNTKTGLLPTGEQPCASALINDILRSPFEGIGKPEALKYQFKGYWSRRIDNEHRLIYKVTDNSVIIISCFSHYHD